MIYEEKSIRSETVFAGRIITVRVDTVLMPDGREATREIVDHPGGVCVVAVTDDEKAVLVKQFRKPVERAIWEIPAGKLEHGEDPLECGIRELEEETGYRADEFISLGHMLPTPGFANETIYVYLARNLRKTSARLDPDEYLDVLEFPFNQVLDMIKNNEINDGKTVFGILKAKEILNL